MSRQKRGIIWVLLGSLLIVSNLAAEETGSSWHVLCEGMLIGFGVALAAYGLSLQRWL